MRMFAVMLVLLGCGGVDGAPRCEPGRVQSCPCAGGGQGSQECGLGGAWSVCVCLSGDAGSDVTSDVTSDAAVDVPHDVPRDVRPVDPRCVRFATETMWCDSGDAGVCVDLQHDPRNCGACGRTCDNVRTECFAGECFVPTPDAGRD